MKSTFILRIIVIPIVIWFGACACIGIYYGDKADKLTKQIDYIEWKSTDLMVDALNASFSDRSESLRLRNQAYQLKDNHDKLCQDRRNLSKTACIWLNRALFGIYGLFQKK